MENNQNTSNITGEDLMLFVQDLEENGAFDRVDNNGNSLYNPNFSLRALFDSKPWFYGDPGTDLRRRFQRKFHYLRRMSEARFEQYLQRMNPASNGQEG